MNAIINVLMRRDRMTKDEATAYVKDEMREVMNMIGEGDFSGAEDYFQSAFGLEPDYLLGAII